MQFKHPEILYALLLLIIPILVHLFQLQRFVKVPFTNVQFLKNIVQQTRKSSKIKKYLVLLTRLLAFTCLIIAFAQPYISKNEFQNKYNTTIYLDNSFSMQAKGENGELLKNSAQKIIENIGNQKGSYTLITNNATIKDLDEKTLKNELINIQYVPNKKELSAVLLQLNSLNNTHKNTTNKNILISDFQNINFNSNTNFTTLNSETTLVQVQPKSNNNVFIDSVYTTNTSGTDININIILKSTENNKNSIPVSIVNGSQLIGKTTAQFNNTKQTEVQFTIENTNNFNGEISIIDGALAFDNNFYFSISKPDKINVLSIGEPATFLAKIYSEKEFNYSSNKLQNLNYNTLQNQQLIILNELETIPISLLNTLKEFYINGGNLVVIPATSTNLSSYNSFLAALNIGVITNKNTENHSITSINYEHPLLKDVFEKEVTNFQYPQTSIFYNTILNQSASILKLDNNLPFIASTATNKSTFYWIASPLNNQATNFTQATLIVPIFYNFAKQSLKINELYYTINNDITIELKADLGKDNVVSIANLQSNFIPLQNIAQHKITLNLTENDVKNGFYTINYQNKALKNIAFNYQTNEGNLSYTNIKQYINNTKNVSISSSIQSFFDDIYQQQKINWLFKWFLAFSVLFLLIEMLLLKYFKL